MQRVGVNVWPLNTVQFSNHTQYGQWAGEVLAPQQIPELVEGIAAIGELGNCDAVLSGYLGSAAQGGRFSVASSASNRSIRRRCTCVTR
jgi:pyridoxine kinase